VAELVSEMIKDSEFYRILDEVVPGGSFGEVKSSQERQLYLTRLSMDGLNEMHNYSIDERLYEYFEYKPFNTIGDTEKYLKRLMNLEGNKILERTAVAWFVRRIDDKKLVGTARLVNIDYNRKSVEWGYGIDPELWGEGYIFEIQELLKEYIFEELGLNRLYGTTMVENERTKSALIAAGCKDEGVLRQYYRDLKGEYHDGWIYSILAEEYFSANSLILKLENTETISMQMIANIIGNVLNQTHIVENDDMKSVPNWDSLNHINIIFEIEKITGYKFSPINISRATSIKKIHDLITLKKEHS